MADDSSPRKTVRMRRVQSVQYSSSEMNAGVESSRKVAFAADDGGIEVGSTGERESERAIRNKYLARPNRRRSDTIVIAPNSDKKSAVREDMLKILHVYYNTDMEGSEEFRSDKAVLKRESIRFDPKILQLLNRIWVWTDWDGSGTVDVDEYVRLYHLLWKLMGKKMEGSGQQMKPMSKKQIDQLARDEFYADCFEGGEMGKAQFFQVFIQLVDTWTETISLDAYGVLLEEVWEVVEASPSPGRAQAMFNSMMVLKRAIRNRRKRKQQVVAKRVSEASQVAAVAVVEIEQIIVETEVEVEKAVQKKKKAQKASKEAARIAKVAVKEVKKAVKEVHVVVSNTVAATVAATAAKAMEKVHEKVAEVETTIAIVKAKEVAYKASRHSEAVVAKMEASVAATQASQHAQQCVQKAYAKMAANAAADAALVAQEVAISIEGVVRKMSETVEAFMARVRKASKGAALAAVSSASEIESIVEEIEEEVQRLVTKTAVKRAAAAAVHAAEVISVQMDMTMKSVEELSQTSVRSAKEAAIVATQASQAAVQQYLASQAEVSALVVKNFLGKNRAYDRFLDADHELIVAKNCRTVYYYLIAAHHRHRAALTTSDPLIRTAAAWALAGAAARFAAECAKEAADAAARVVRKAKKLSRGIVYYNLQSARIIRPSNQEDSGGPEPKTLLDFYMQKWSRAPAGGHRHKKGTATGRVPVRPSGAASSRMLKKQPVKATATRFKDNSSRRKKKSACNRASSYMAGPTKPRFKTEAWGEREFEEAPPPKLVRNAKAMAEAKKRQQADREGGKFEPPGSGARRLVVPHKKFNKIVMPQAFEHKALRAKEWRKKYPEMKQQAWEDCCLTSMPNPQYTMVQYRPK